MRFDPIPLDPDIGHLGEVQSTGWGSETQIASGDERRRGRGSITVAALPAHAGDDDLFGGYQAILFRRAPGLRAPREWATAGDPPVNGVYHAASDFRKDGEAVGW
jgi:hypothetical protein